MSKLVKRCDFLVDKLLEREYIPLYGFWDNSVISFAKLLDCENYIYSVVYAKINNAGDQVLRLSFVEQMVIDDAMLDSGTAVYIEIATDFEDSVDFFSKCSEKLINVLDWEKYAAKVIENNIKENISVSSEFSENSELLMIEIDLFCMKPRNYWLQKMF